MNTILIHGLGGTGPLSPSDDSGTGFRSPQLCRGIPARPSAARDALAVACLALLVDAVVPIGVAAPQAPQASSLSAWHHAGQTFLTWREAASPLQTDQVSFPMLRQVTASLDKPDKVRYRLYRALQPITNVHGLPPIAEIKPLGCWASQFNGYGDPKVTDLVPRFIIRGGEPPLPPGTGLYVHNPKPQPPDEGQPAPASRMKAFYAVTRVLNGVENKVLDATNSLPSAVEESAGQGEPVLQRVERPKEFNYVQSPTLHYFVRWEAPPNCNVENQPIDYVVGLPPKVQEPAPVTLLLHCWGGTLNSGYGWWYNAERGHVMIAANQIPYDWWTGYHELRGLGERTKDAWQRGVVRPYTQTRLLSFLDWAATQWRLDRTRVAVGGSSMGGSGAPMFAIRYPERIAWAIGWVGVHVPARSPTFSDSYAQVFGAKEWQVKFEDGTPVWDHFDDAWYLRRHPDKEIGFISWSNGKNDGGIGWPQAVEFFRAMQDTRRPHLFVWGQGGHGQRAVMLGGAGEERNNPLDLRTDQSLPAFTHCSLDANPGNGQPDDGDAQGSVNYYLLWETRDIIEAPDRWEMTVWLTANAPRDECTVDLTPRRLQNLRRQPGDKFNWSNRRPQDGALLQSGEVAADHYGLLTIEKLRVSKGKNRVQMVRQIQR